MSKLKDSYKLTLFKGNIFFYKMKIKSKIRFIRMHMAILSINQIFISTIGIITTVIKIVQVHDRY